FDLALDGKSEKVLVKEVQYDHLGSEVIHVDFARVSLDERVEVTVPVELKGEPKNDGEVPGVVTQVINELEIDGLVTETRPASMVTTADRRPEDQMRIADPRRPAGGRTKMDADGVGVTFKEGREEKAPPAAEGETAEPEVIGRKPEEEAAAEGAAP